MKSDSDGRADFEDSSSEVGFDADTDVSGDGVPDVNSLAIPESLGKYRVERELGRGGMGVVLQARDPILGRPVALKILSESFAGNPEWSARFRREAVLLASINHPNIATIYSLESEGPFTFITMELIEGNDLGAILHSGALGVGEALSVARQVARGLEAAHHQNLIHRDLKPKNVMITQDGRAKILDFGLATRAGTGEVERQLRRAGTPGYMSPEQIQGRDLDARTDLWSFGCLLHECLTGAPTFPGNSTQARMEATIRSRPDLTDLPVATPDSIRSLLTKCLEQDPAERLATAEEARKVLEDAIAERSWQERGKKISGAHNLPQQVSSFVGRTEQLAKIHEILGTHRIVTLKGVGGAGKTRVAIKSGEQAVEQFPDGVWWIELASLQRADEVPRRVSRVLSISDSGEEVVDRLRSTLASKKTLLIFDNCEHLSAAVAELVEALTRACPEVSILATSREPLGLAGELVYPLAPLRTPSSKSTLEGIRRADSVELFRARAAQVRPDFDITEENASAVADICRHLDGIPLAIELAAARVRMMPPNEIATRLDQRFRFLTASTRNALPQHRTLEALIEWSHGQLSHREQALFRRLAVFSGGWTLEAAEEVCVLDASDEPIESWEVIDLLSGLIDKSLVELDGSIDAGPRYQMLETIREFARLQLKRSGEMELVSWRHCRYFDSFVAALDRAVSDRGDAERMDAIEREHENLRRALRTAFSKPDPELAISLSSKVVWMRHIRGYWSEGRRDLERAMSLPGADQVPDELRLSAFAGLAVLAMRQGDGQRAKQGYENAIELALKRGDVRTAAAYRVKLLSVYIGLHLFSEGLEAAESILQTEGLSPMLRGETLVATANILFSLQRLTEARPRYEAALKLYRELGMPEGLATTLLMLGATASHQKRFQESLRLHEEALEILRRLGDRWKTAGGLANLVPVRAALGQFEQMRDELAEAGATALELQEIQLTAGVVHGFALVAEHDGDFERSARLLGAAECFLGTGPNGEEDVALTVRLRQSLGEETLDRLMMEGTLLSPEQAIALGRSGT